MATRERTSEALTRGKGGYLSRAWDMGFARLDGGGDSS